MNQEGNVLHVTTNLKISSSIDDKYLQDEHSLDEHFEVNGKILNESNFLCINCGPQVSILRKSNGSKYSFWSADRTTRDTVTKITCLVEVDLGSGVPLLAAGTEEGLLCFYYTGVSRILRAVQFNKKIVSLALLDNGDHSEIGNWISLPEELQLMNGVLAVGLDGGAIYLVDICRHLLEKSILEGGPVNIENPSQLLFINLRTDTASDIQAKKEYAMSHPGETLAIFLNESTIDQFRKMVTSNISSPVQRRSFDNSIEEFHLVVTALAYFKEIACLAVGFNSGCFQLWHLSLFRIIYVSPLMDAQVMPIAGFSLQEPTDDPHSVCFIWAAHQSASTGACRPFAAMYMVSFSSKKHIDGYGCFYENYKGCQSRYELSLGEDVDSVIDGRIICCHSISRVIQRRFPQWSMHSGNEDESIVSLCAIAWEVWTPDRTNVTSKLTLFDINQWYRAQMPGSLEVGGSNSYVTNLLLPNDNEEQPAPLLDVLISAESLKQFSAYQPLDEHYFPLSLSFACTCLYEHKKLECVWKGVQNELISSLESAGPSALLEPSRFFHRFLSVGLKPSFYEASDSANLSVMTERQMLLTVMLEQGHASFVKDCVRMWADGCLAVANCTLPTLLRWGWSAVTFYKQMADNICIQLFDLRSTPTMKEFVYVVSLLHKLSEIFDYILKNYRNFILEDNVELQSISLQLFIEYLDSVVWSTQHKLLPEVNEPSKTFDDVIQYPQIKLQNYILERREKMRQLSRKLLDVNGQLCLADLLLVDALLKTAPGGKRIISQWEAEGSLVGGLYPPPSLQSVLRIFLIRGVATDFKHMLIYYFLLDVTDLLQQDNPHGAKMLQNFVTKFRLSKSQVLITKAFWLIDHGKLKEAVDHLTHGNVNQNDITESNHKIVMYSLFVQGEPRLALAYSRAFNPQLGELEDAKFHLLLLLECGHILQAFDFQRKYRQWQTELLDLFFTVCMRRKELGIVYKLSLDSSEEEAFTQFLEANRHPHSEDLRVIYLLSRARYVEAIDVNKKLAVKRAQGPTPTPLFERRTPLKGLAFKKNSQKPKEDESRDQIRDVIVSAFAKTLPPITRELADFCSRQKNTLGTWKKVDRPDPLSVAVNQQPKQAGLKERFVELALAKTRQTWAPLLATPHALKSRLRSTVEETPFLRSTPFSFKSKANSPRSTEHNQSLMSASKFSAKRGLGLDDVDEASSILKSESRTKRARLDFDEILEKKRHNDNEGVTLLSTPFIKRKRAAVPSEVTPRTPLSILKSPWKSGQSSLSRQSDRGEAPSSPMPRQIRFCEELETESSVDKRSSSSAATPSRATIRFDAKSSEECHQEISETDEDIDMNSTPSHNQSDSENGDTEQSFIKVKLSVDEEKSRNRSQLESVIEKDANLTKTVDLEDENEQPQSEEDVSVIDVPSFDSQVENSSPDRVPSSPSRLSNYDHKERYADDEEEQVEEQKTYQDLSTASVFVNVSGELESSVYELEEGEIGAPEHDSIGVNEVADMAEEVVYSNEVGQEKEKEPGELDEEEDRVDIYAGIDDDDDVVKEDNLEPGDDEYYEDEFMENYRRGELEDKAEVKDSGSEVHEGRGSEDIKNEREEEDDDEEDEDEERKRQDEDDDDEVICLDDSSKSDGTSQEEEPVTVIPKRNRISSEDELDYEESRMYEDYGDEVAGGDNDFDEELEEEEAGEEEFAEEEEHLSDEEEHMEEEEEGEEEEEEEEDEEEYAQHLRSEDDDDDEDGVIDDCGGENREEVKNNIFNDPRSDKSSGHLDTNLNRSKGTSGGKLEGSKRFINPFCKKREVASTSIQDNSNVPESGKIASNEGEESQSVEVEQVDVSHDNQRLIESVVKVSDDSKCEVNDEEVDADNSELKIVSVTGNSSVFHQNQSAHESQHDESFGKLEISFEGDPESESIPIKQVEKSMTVDETALEMESRLDPESESIPIKQVEKSMTVDETALVMEEESAENRTEGSTVNESASEVVQSRLDTIEEVSVENQTEGSTMLASETTENKKADEKLETVVTSDDKLESNSNEPVSGRTEDVPNLDGTVVDRSFSTPLRTRRNRRSSSEVPPSRDLKLRRSARKSVSSNHLNELPLSAAEDKNMSKDFFDNSPTVPLDIRNTRSRRSSSVQRTPSKITRQSLGKSISTSLIADMTKMQAEDATVSSSQAMEETLKTPRLNSLKHPDSSTIEEKPELTMVSSCSEPVVESMVIEDTTNKTIDVQQTIEQEKTDLGFISDNKTTTEEVEVDETLQKKTEGKETDGNIVEESESIVEPSVDEKLSSTNRNKETVEEAMVALKKTTEGNETSTENIVEESMSVEPVVEETTVVEESGNIVEKKHSIVEQTADKEVEETVAATVTAVMDSSSSVKDIRRPGSRGTFSEAPESVYNENEDPVIPKPLPRRAASVSKLDDDTGKLSRIRRSSRRYRSGMVWSEYVKNVDSYNKFPLNSSCASSVSSALDVADDVSIASVRESISTATTATGATARKLRRSRFMDRSFLKTAIRSYDILLSDEEADDTTKSAVVSNVKPTRSSSVISVVGSVPTVAEEISPIKQVHSENAESQKEIESKLEHNDSMLTIHEEEEVEGLEEQDVDVVNETKNDGKIDTVISKRTRKGRTETKPKQKTPSETKDDDSDDSSSDMLLTELKSKVRKEKGRKKSVDVDSKVKDEKVEVSKPTKRSRSISSLSSKKTQSSLVDEGGEEEVSGRARLRRGRTSRSESPVGLRKLARKTSTVDGDLFGDDSPDTSLTSSLQRTFKRDLRRSKLLDRPPSRNVLDVIMSENEEEEENDVEEGDKKTKKEVKKRGKKEVIQDEDEGNSTPKGKRGRAKSVVLSDVESTPATPKRGRRAKQVAEDSDASMNAASSSKPKRSRRSSVMQETTPTKSRTPRIFSSPDSVASNASATATSKKRKRRSHLMPAASTPDSNAQSDVSVIDSSIMDYTSSRRLTRHQLANMQKFPMRKEKLDESTIIEEHPSDSEDEGSVAESSVSSVMSTRSSARLRMKSMKK